MGRQRDALCVLGKCVGHLLLNGSLWNGRKAHLGELPDVAHDVGDRDSRATIRPRQKVTLARLLARLHARKAELLHVLDAHQLASRYTPPAFCLIVLRNFLARCKWAVQPTV